MIDPLKQALSNQVKDFQAQSIKINSTLTQFS